MVTCSIWVDATPAELTWTLTVPDLSVDAGVPDSVAVPLSLSWKVRPARRAGIRSVDPNRVELVGAYSNKVLQSQHLRDLRTRIDASQGIRRARRIRRQKAPRRLSHEEILELVRAYREGLTVYELATQFGIHRETVSGVLEGEGVPRRGRPLTPAQIERAASLYENGWSLAQVGAELKCDPSTVWRALRRHGSSA